MGKKYQGKSCTKRQLAFRKAYAFLSNCQATDRSRRIVDAQHLLMKGSEDCPPIEPALALEVATTAIARLEKAQPDPRSRSYKKPVLSPSSA